MNDTYTFLLGTLLFLSVPISCAIFCAWFDYKQDEIKRMCVRKNREYYEYEQRNKTNH
jgi:hypothetical protein